MAMTILVPLLHPDELSLIKAISQKEYPLL
jgi:hypothetical protein